MGRTNRGGRPRVDEGDRGTVQVRINADIAEKAAWVVRVLGSSMAMLLDPMIRADIEALYKRHQTEIEEIQKAEAQLREVEQDAKQRAEKKHRKES